jgi:hypothetical protein
MDECAFMVNVRRRDWGAQGWRQEEKRENFMERALELIHARATNGNAILSIMSSFNITIKDLQEISSIHSLNMLR